MGDVAFMSVAFGRGSRGQTGKAIRAGAGVGPGVGAGAGACAGGAGVGAGRVRRLLAAGMMAAGLAGVAPAQDAYLLSFSGNGQWPGLSVEDQEIVCFDPGSGAVLPFLCSANGAYFNGDQDQDGLADEWNDVDGLCVMGSTASRAGEILLSLLADQGAVKDGDIVALTADGQILTRVAEATLVAAFGVTDGNLDVDAIHHDGLGGYWLSFAEDEASSLLSTDQAGVITDGSILHYDSVTQFVRADYLEADVDAMVSQALGSAVSVGDVLGLSVDSRGFLAFTVQSPSSDDASVFSIEGGGTVLLSEAALGTTNSAELDALSLQGRMAFVGTQVEPIQPGPGIGVQIDLHAPGAARRCSVMLSWTRGSANLWPGAGFHGLYLEPSDVLLPLSLIVPWTQATTDGAGRATLTLPPVPVGFQATLFGQVLDWTTGSFGAPFTIELQG